jgi:hypothetical protein
MEEAEEAMEFAMQCETASAPSMPHFEAMESELELKAPPRDYAADFSEAPRRAAEQNMTDQNTMEQDMTEQDLVEQEMAEQYLAKQAQGPETSLFPESAGDSERDLDVPTFLRRLKF